MTGPQLVDGRRVQWAVPNMPAALNAMLAMLALSDTWLPGTR